MKFSLNALYSPVFPNSKLLTHSETLEAKLEKVSDICEDYAKVVIC